jgi:predicted 3-demethylubiquinone-9 3-methyltransferase (glyoxalase superfamily)
MITPCLWFDSNAEEAVKFYTSVFLKSKIGKVSRYDEETAKRTGRPKGSVLTAEFVLGGRPFFALNGGPVFKFTEAISFAVHCRTQREVDYYWKKLSKGGQESQCGWLKDRFGVSWQVVPSILGKLLTDRDAEKAQRVMHAMMQMRKLDIKKLEQAYHAGHKRAKNR